MGSLIIVHSAKRDSSVPDPFRDSVVKGINGLAIYLLVGGEGAYEHPIEPPLSNRDLTLGK